MTPEARGRGVKTGAPSFLMKTTANFGDFGLARVTTHGVQVFRQFVEDLS
jgi:hypothetical protein